MEVVTTEKLNLPQVQAEKLEIGLRLVNSLNFSMVRLKLMDVDEGQGWDKDYAEYVEQRYKRYLCMLYVTRDFPIVPTGDIDLFWHQHILDTRAYAKDCEFVFGEFLHHFPYFGMRSEEDAQDLLDSFEKTKVFYERLFGEQYTKDYYGEHSDKSKCHKCSSRCKKCASGCGGIQCKRCYSS